MPAIDPVPTPGGDPTVVDTTQSVDTQQSTEPDRSVGGALKKTPSLTATLTDIADSATTLAAPRRAPAHDDDTELHQMQTQPHAATDAETAVASHGQRPATVSETTRIPPGGAAPRTSLVARRQALWLALLALVGVGSGAALQTIKVDAPRPRVRSLAIGKHIAVGALWLRITNVAARDAASGDRLVLRLEAGDRRTPGRDDLPLLPVITTEDGDIGPLFWTRDMPTATSHDAGNAETEAIRWIVVYQTPGNVTAERLNLRFVSTRSGAELLRGSLDPGPRAPR